jgi:hypothetical protein
MTCEKCGHKEVIFYERDLQVKSKSCPACDNIYIISKEVSLEAIGKEYEYIDKLLVSKIKGFNKSSLFFGLLIYSEILIGKFLNGSPLINLTDLLSTILLLKKSMIYYKDPGDIEATKENIKELFLYCNYLVNLKVNQFSIEEEYGYFAAKEHLDIINIELGKLGSKLIFCNDEDWLTVIESFDQNLIKPYETAQDYVEEHKDEYDEKAHDLGSKLSTPEEWIHALYPLFLSFKYGLTKNRLFAETFDFKYMKNKRVLIESFSNINKYSDLFCEQLIVLSVENFKHFLNESFKEFDQEQLYNDLVFKYENQTVFPLFIEFENFTIKTSTHTIKYNSCIISSMTLLKVIKLFYYPIYYEKLYHDETVRLSKHFENNIIPGEFYKMGFNVRVDVKKKNTFQIDTIAWNSNVLYVIETKLWDISKYFEHRRAHNQRERDLKGIVDGYEYSYGREERIPSLTSKVNYVKANLTEISSKYAATQMFPDHDTSWNNIDKRIMGLIVTKSYPPLKEYNGIKMIGFGEIKDL